MFFRIVLSYLIGYLRIEVTGYYIERFINLCNNNHILTWNLKKGKDSNIFLNIGIKELKEVVKFAKKTKCKIKIRNKKGLPFIINKYRKRKVFIISLVLIILGIWASSNFIWNIDIDSETEIPNIMQDLEEAGLKTGILKTKIDTKDIINKINIKREDLAWMGIELKGTNAIVKIVKATEKPEIIPKDKNSNIVSNKQGVVTKINAQNGTAQVKPGDVVTEGTVLIGGWMEGKYTGIRYVHAEGEVEAKVWYTKKITIKYNTTETRETGEFENKFKIKFNKFEIFLNKRVSKFKIYDTIETEKKFKLFSNLYLPISIVKITNKELENIEKNYSVEEAKNLGIQELQEQLDSEIQDKQKIVDKNINTYEKEDAVDVYVTYEVLEKIGTNEEI